jgi:hypothetical protein
MIRQGLRPLWRRGACKRVAVVSVCLPATVSSLLPARTAVDQGAPSGLHLHREVPLAPSWSLTAPVRLAGQPRHLDVFAFALGSSFCSRFQPKTPGGDFKKSNKACACVFHFAVNGRPPGETLTNKGVSNEAKGAWGRALSAPANTGHAAEEG